MFYISKAIKGKEFLHSKQFSVKCKSKKQAETLAKWLNDNNDTTITNWKCKENETWHVYEDGEWYADFIPFKVKIKNGNVSIVANV